MSKKKKKSRSMVYSPEAIGSVKKSLRQFNWRRALSIALSTLAVFAIFEALLSYEAQKRLTFSPVTAVYYTIVTVLAVTVIILNHGFSKKPFTPDMVREDITREEAEAICRKLNRHKAIAKKLMFILVPFIFALLLDVIYLFYGDTLYKIIGLFVPTQTTK
jgi:hypothetical protein